MSVNRIPRKRLEKKLRSFLKRGIPYRMENTNERTVIHAAGRWGSWMNKESSFLPQNLSFIKQVKQHIIKNETYKNVRNTFKKEGSAKRIKYYYYNKNLKPGLTFEKIKEIDIKNAYWDTAYMATLFHKEMYEKGLTVDKRTRLAAIGSLAKVTEVIEFDGKEEKYLDPIRQEQTEFLWNVISYRIGKLMAKASRASKSDFLFFWVDAIFVKGEYEKEIKQIFKDAGYKCESYNCEWIRFEEKKVIVKSTEKGKWVYNKVTKKKEFKDERPFPFKQVLTEKDIINLSSSQ